MRLDRSRVRSRARSHDHKSYDHGVTKNKGIQLKKYTLYDKNWLNSKYIKIKQNQKLKGKFLKLF